MTENAPSSPAGHPGEERLITELRRALDETIFTSGLRIAPRRMNQIAQEAAASFLHFLGQEDEAAARAYGQHLVQEGLGHRSILFMTEALRRVCMESPNPGIGLLPAAGRYANAILEGYMAGREASLLQEQERTFRAVQRAQGQNPPETGDLPD